MPQATGALTKILGVTQATFKVEPVAPDAEILYVRTFDFSDNQPLEQDPTLAGGLRGALRGQKGRIDASGSAALSIAPSIAFWLKHLIGAPTTTGAGPYTHTFLVGPDPNAIPAAALFETDYSDRIATPGRYVRNQDVRVESATFSFSSASAFQQATFNLRGASLKSLPATPIDATPTDYGHAAWGIANLALVLDAGATEVCVETLNFTWNNDLDTDLYCINEGGQRHDLPEGQVLITGDGVAQFDTPALMAKAIADEDLALQITLSRGDGLGSLGNESLVITIPLSVITAPTPGVTGPRGLKQNFNFSAFRTTGTEVGVTAVLKAPRATV
jgi:hypothetical protein